MGKVTQLQLRRDLNASVPTLAEGELFVSTDTFQVTLGSITNGNMPLVTASKKYKAIWQGSGGSGFVVYKIFEDTIGGEFNGTSSANENYTLTNTGAFTLNKTDVKVSNCYDQANGAAYPSTVIYQSLDVNHFDIVVTGDVGDGIFINIDIEVFF